MDPLRILFMGTPDFAVPSLQALIDGPDQVVAVVCQPDRRRGRGKKLQPPPVKVLAESVSLPVLQPTSIRTDEFLDQVRELHPDLSVVAAYGKILPGPLIRLPRLGTINVHGSLLPRYRGAAPIQWALIRGEQETGVTIMQMDEGMDTGDILLPASIPIGEDDTAGTLFERIARLGADTLVRAIDLLKQGKLTPTPQDDALATEAPMLTKEQGHLDWERSARELHRLIRGLDPWPSAYGFIQGQRVRFFSPRLTRDHSHAPPGTITGKGEDGMVVATGDLDLVIRQVQPEGRKRMDALAWLNGRPQVIGQRVS